MDYSLNTRCTNLIFIYYQMYTLCNISIKITSSIRIIKKAQGT